MKEPRAKINKGFRVGSLTVMEPTDQRKSGYFIWLCKCDCGGEIKLDTRCLQRGTVTDCGCMKNVKPGTRDISGQRFGKLIAMEPTEERGYSRSVVWKCQCDCGNECYVSLHQLQAGYVKSCGCLSHPPLKDFVGEQFGKLTVTEYAGKRDGMHQWKCRCDCGNETVVGQTRLQSGKTQSCGCMQATAYLRNPGIIDGTSVGILEYYKTHLSPFNTSGHTGVYQSKKSGKWIAQIGFKGKTYHLGSYSEFQEAVQARERGEAMHDEFLEWYYQQYPERLKEQKQDGFSVTVVSKMIMAELAAE